MAREELGFDPNELGGSAWVAAGTSLALFALGAVVPLLPFLFYGGQAALFAAAGLSAVAIFALGAGITRLTGIHPVRSGLRQLAFGASAAAITYGSGSWSELRCADYGNDAVPVGLLSLAGEGGYAVLGFVLVTNQMGQTDLDFEKGVATGATDALQAIEATIAALDTETQSPPDLARLRSPAN